MKKSVRIIICVLAILAAIVMLWGCGEEEPAHTHDFKETIKAPTCTDKGLKTLKCACGEEQKTDIAALGHTGGEAVIENEVKPNCENGGTYDLVVYCTVCDGEVSREAKTTEALGHTGGEPVTENRVEAECGRDGSYDLVVYCTVCGGEVSREARVIEADPHTAGEAVIENEVKPNCENDGTYDLVIYCTVCGGEVSREAKTTEALGHTDSDAVVENEVEAKCNKEGSYDVVVYCATCGDEVSRETKTIPTVSHTPAIPVVENDKRESCTVASSYEAVTYCNICHTELKRELIEVPATDHIGGDPVKENITPETCTENGSCEVVVYCKNCNNELSREQQVIEAAHKFENSVCTVCGKSQAYTRDGDKIYMGSYPQTKVTDSKLITQTLNSLLPKGSRPSASNPNGWTSYRYYSGGVIKDYMWYYDVETGGERYRAVYFKAYRPNNCGDSSNVSNSRQDDYYYYTDTVYWFKYEPVVWDVVKEENGKAYLVCNMIIDAQPFNYGESELNSYEESTVRAWLNDSFYNMIFSEVEKSIILTTLVDNSAKSTGYSTNQYACNDTEDKVFLMSYLEGTTYFEKYDERLYKEATDYANCQGATGDSFILRSPDKNSNNSIRQGSGHMGWTVYTSEIYSGIVAMIQITL